MSESSSAPGSGDLRRLVCTALERVRQQQGDDAPASRDTEGRPVITAADLERREPGERWRLPPGAVITPAARDRAAELGVLLVSSVDGDRRAGLPGPSPAEEPLVDQLVRQLSRELSSRELEELACWCRTDCLVEDPGRVDAIVEAGADRIGVCTTNPPVGDAIAPLIDHTLLKPEATEEQIADLCDEALRFGFASVCVNPYYVPLAADLVGSDPCVRVCTVVGFPLGANMPEIKAVETTRALDDGADEIDMVVNVGALKSGRHDWVRHDIASVVRACRDRGAVVKVILETALLEDDEVARGCRLSEEAGADFVKTSTGFGPGGATVDDVALMRRTVGREMGVKASGGIGSREDAARMIAAGATRIGASAGVRIAGGGGRPGGDGRRGDDEY